jgi:hypothetical protein
MKSRVCLHHCADQNTLGVTFDFTRRRKFDNWATMCCRAESFERSSASRMISAAESFASRLAPAAASASHSPRAHMDMGRAAREQRVLCNTRGRGSLNYVKGCCCCCVVGQMTCYACMCARSLSDCQFPYTRWLSIVRGRPRKEGMH